ncbi:MAG: hypothetical protein JSV76_05545 [Candidatus Bathyarchaeota archaeon]|nr:MAG: hypothetical protein JSV76_05545 [Candidatus Bathyarchaeota archaeon]
MRITIWTKATGTIQADLSESKNPKTAKAVQLALPIEAKVATWGDELYFPIPVKAEKENSQQVVALGDIAYWPPGNALCIFFGLTPASVGNEIRPASAVNVIGKVLENHEVFKRVNDGDLIKIDKLE